MVERLLKLIEILDNEEVKKELNDLIELYKNETDENAKNLESIKSERDKLTKMLITNGKTEDSSDYEEDFE